jgi:hypothetical protein
MTRRTRTDKTMTGRKRTTGQTIFYKTSHRTLKTDQHEPHKISGMNSEAPEE